MYETVRIINGKEIMRMKGTTRYYKVYTDKNKYIIFHTIKAATEYIVENL